MPRKAAGKHQSRHARDPARTKCAKAQIRTNTVTLGSLMQRAGACRDQSGHDFTLQSPQIRSKFCRGRARKQAWDPARAEHRCRAKALVRTKADTLGIPLGPNPCQGADKDQHRHAREFNATRRRLQGPKRPGSLARSGSRSGQTRAKAQIRTNTVTLGSLMQRAGACRDQSGHDFTLQSPQIRSKFCRGRARKQAWDLARAEHRCRAKALVRTRADTLGIPLGPNPCQGADKD